MHWSCCRGRWQKRRAIEKGPGSVAYIALALQRYWYNNSTLNLALEIERLKSGKIIACLPTVRSCASRLVLRLVRKKEAKSSGGGNQTI